KSLLLSICINNLVLLHSNNIISNFGTFDGSCKGYKFYPSVQRFILNTIIGHQWTRFSKSAGIEPVFSDTKFYQRQLNGFRPVFGEFLVRLGCSVAVCVTIDPKGNIRMLFHKGGNFIDGGERFRSDHRFSYIEIDITGGE